MRVRQLTIGKQLIMLHCITPETRILYQCQRPQKTARRAFFTSVCLPACMFRFPRRASNQQLFFTTNLYRNQQRFSSSALCRNLFPLPWRKILDFRQGGLFVARHFPRTGLNVTFKAHYLEATQGSQGQVSATKPMWAAMIASSLGQPNFYIYFKLAGRGDLTAIIGAIVSLFTVGGGFGVVLTSYLQDKYWRKKALLLCSFFHLLRTGLAAASVKITMVIRGRFFLGIGAWGLILGTIVYSQEIAPATQRGILGGAIGAAITNGYFLAAWVGVGFYSVGVDWNWRIPVALPAWSIILALIAYRFVPESPRWLVAQGRYDEALTVLKYLHGSKTDTSFLIAREEHYQIVKQFRRRTYAILTLSFFCMITGIQIISNYGPIIYATIGFSPRDSLLVAAGTSNFNYLLSWVCASLVDRTGRRAMLFFSMTGPGLVLILIAGLLANYDGTQKAMGNAIVALFYVYLIFFSFSEPVVYIYVGVIFPTHVRTKGIALANIMICAMTVWITMCQLIAQAAIGYRFYLIFAVLSSLGGFLYWYLSETKNVPLEEIPKLFGDGVAVEFSQIQAQMEKKEKNNFATEAQS